MSQPAGQTADQYDLGSPTAPPPTPPAEPAAAAQPGAPLRRPDGTFLPKHSHPDRLVRQARDLGFSDEEIASASTADLRADVQSARMEQLLGQRATTISTALEREPTPQPAAPTAPTSLEVPVIDEQEWLPEVVTLFKLVKDLQARVQAIEPAVGEIRGFHQAQTNRTLTEQCDAFFAKDPDRFGKGTVNEIKEDSPEYARRMLVIEQAKKLPQDLSVQAKLQKAQEIIYGASAAPAPPSPTPEPTRAAAVTPEQWREAGLARPTQREGGAEPPGKKKAIETIQRFYQENGVGQSEPNVADEFPG